jgi:hypothetical protein
VLGQEIVYCVHGKLLILLQIRYSDSEKKVLHTIEDDIEKLLSNGVGSSWEQSIFRP